MPEASKPSLPLRKVCPRVLRLLFNSADFLERVRLGELAIEAVDDYEAPPSAGQPPGTRSQFLEIRTLDGIVIARAFQYLRPDGTVGASGRPDPKWLRTETEILRGNHGNDARCEECAG